MQEAGVLPPPTAPAPPGAFQPSVAAAAVIGLGGTDIPPPPPTWKAPPAHMCGPPTNPEEALRRAQQEEQRAALEATCRAADKQMEEKQKEISLHHAAVARVLYDRLDVVRRAEIDKIEDTDSKIAALVVFRAELLSPGEITASSVEEFAAEVQAHEARAQVACSLLTEQDKEEAGDRKGGEAGPRL